MKHRKITVSFLFTLLFVISANAQETASAQAVEEYNTLKSLIVLALMILALVFLYRSSKYKAVKKTDNRDAKTDNNSVPDEVVAAIIMMLNDMDEDVHDKDNTVLTMRKVTRNYSPWNSKIFGLRQMPYIK
jgi:phosphatidylglycerophosphatase A